MHGAERLKARIAGAENFSGGDSSGSVVIGTAGDEDVSSGEQRGVRATAPGGHFWERLKFASCWIVEFGGIGAIVTNPTTGDEDLAGAKQNGNESNTRDVHLSCRYKFSCGRVV